MRVCQVDPSTVTSPRGLLYRTARNLALNTIKRTSITPERLADDLAALVDAANATSSAEDALLSSESARAILAAINALPETQCKALLMRQFERLSAQEIARHLGVSPRGKFTSPHPRVS